MRNPSRTFGQQALAVIAAILMAVNPIADPIERWLYQQVAVPLVILAARVYARVWSYHLGRNMARMPMLLLRGYFAHIARRYGAFPEPLTDERIARERAEALGMASADFPSLNRATRRALLRMPVVERQRWLLANGMGVSGGAATVGSRSGIFWRQIPGGLPVIQDHKSVTGSIFFIDSGTAQGGTTAGFGSHPDKALTTWDSVYGTGLAAAGQGDTAFVLPGHAETVSAAAGVTIDVAGVSIVGIGRGNARPTITFGTATTADIEIDSANTFIQNMRFVGNIAALAAPIDVDAAACWIVDCDFYVATATTDVDIAIITDANADDLLVYGCNFWYDYSRAATAVTAASTEVIRLVGADRAHIEKCYFSGNFATAIVNGITTASGDIYVGFCRLYNDQTTNIAGWIDLVAGCTGVIEYNSGFHGYTTDIATVIDPASCAMIENYASNVVTEAGGIIGTRST